MKNKSFFLIVLLAMATYVANAGLWRVNNTPGMSADFNNFAAAQQDAIDGDTIYMEGSVTSYGSIYIDKHLVIIGPGFFLSENPNTQANRVTAIIDYVAFQAGSAGSVLMGMWHEGSIEISVENISLIGNYFNGPIYLNNYSNNIVNTLIKGNYIISAGCNALITEYSYSYPVSSCTIINNYLEANCYGDYANAIQFSNNTDFVISNNVIRGNLSTNNAIYSNNILIAGNVEINDNSFYNNLCNLEQFPAENYNQLNVNMDDVFVGPTGNSTDGQYQLASGSPATGAGNDGNDCGMFGGAAPYILSGMPPVPSIYEINIPAAGNQLDGITVTVKAQSH